MRLNALFADESWIYCLDTVHIIPNLYSLSKQNRNKTSTQQEQNRNETKHNTIMHYYLFAIASHSMVYINTIEIIARADFKIVLIGSLL